MKKSLAIIVVIIGLLCLLGPFIYECISLMNEIQKPGEMLCSPVWLAAIVSVTDNPLWVLMAVVGLVSILYGCMFLRNRK